MAAARGVDAGPSPSECPDSLPVSRPEVLTVELLRCLIDAAQSGRSEFVAERCSGWCRADPPLGDDDRFALLCVLFVCAQVDRTTLDESDIIEQMMAAARGSGHRAARATAHAARAVMLATRGRYALAIPDLGRAAVLIEQDVGTTAVDERELHLRRLACNTMAVALSRQGIHDHAVRWVREYDRTFDDDPEAATGRFRASFAEAWIELTRALEPDPGPQEPPADEPGRFLLAAQGFRAAANGWRDRTDDPAVVTARWLAVAAAVLGGAAETVDELRAAVDGSEHHRPDHRAVCQLALARIDFEHGDPGAAVARLDAALESLPADQAFRSIALRLMWEKVAVAFRTGPSRAEVPVRVLLGVMFRDRREERASRSAAYESAVRQERRRLTLLADRDRAQIDPVTGLATRATLDGHLASILELVAREKVSAVVVFLDLDGFKEINDRNSHLSGDRVLAIFGTLLRESMTDRDAAVRYGGDEFVMVIVGQDVAGARVRLGELRQAFGAATHHDVGTAVTFSAGIVDVVAGSSVGDLLFQADRAMLAGKRAGRDTVITGSVRRVEQ